MAVGTSTRHGHGCGNMVIIPGTRPSLYMRRELLNWHDFSINVDNFLLKVYKIFDNNNKNNKIK